MPESLAQACPMLQDGNLLDRAGRRLGGRGRQDRKAGEVPDAAAGKLARGWVQVANARTIIARPAQAARAIGRPTATIPTPHETPPHNLTGVFARRGASPACKHAG